MGQVESRVASLGPDSTDHSTPIRTDDRKTCPRQTSKKLKFRCRPYSALEFKRFNGLMKKYVRPLRAL